MRNDVIFFNFFGSVPSIPLFEMYSSVAFEKVVANQSGSLVQSDDFGAI